jgi:hypothetical protein
MGSFVLVFLSVAIAFTSVIVISCNKQRFKNEKDSYIVMRNLRDFYDFTIFLNSEPIRYANGYSIFEWKDFPLKNGHNKIDISVRIRENFDAMFPSNAKFKLAIIHGDKLFKLNEIIFPLSGVSQISHSFVFDIEGVPSDEDVLEQVLNVNSSSIENIKTITIAILSMLYRKDFEKLAQLFYLKSGIEFKNQYPSWIFLDKTFDLSVNYVQNIKELEVVYGKKVILVRAKGSSNLVSDENALFAVKRSDPESEFLVQCLVFMKTLKSWCIAGSKGFMPINLDVINKTNGTTVSKKINKSV